MISRTEYGRSASRIFAMLTVLFVSALNTLGQDQSQYDRGTPPQHAAGVSQIGSYTSADLGTINLSNGSLNFKLPLGNVGGRGFALPLTLNYSSKLWSGHRGQVFNPEPSPGHNEAAVWAAYNDYSENVHYAVAPGWTVGAVPYLKARGQGINSIHNPNGCTDYSWVLVKLTLVLPDRGEIELRDDQLDEAPATAQVFGSSGCRVQDAYRGKRWHATDGSGVVFINTTDNGVVNGDLQGSVITADGTRYHFVMTPSNTAGSAYINLIAQCDWIRDRNGNKVTINYPNNSTVQFTDQLGRVTTLKWDDPFGTRLYDPDNPSVILAALVTLPGYNGASRYYKIKTGTMNLNYRSDINPTLPVWNGSFPTVYQGTNLFASSHELGAERVDTNMVLTKLILPDNRSLIFKYNEFGEVAEVQMPTGAKVQYDFLSLALDTTGGNGLPSGNSLTPEVIAGPGSVGGGNVKAVDRAVTARRTYPDGSTIEGTSAYAYKIDKTEVTCTAGGLTLLDEWHYFMPAERYLTGSISAGPDGTGYSSWSTGVERRSEVVNGSAVLSATEQDWFRRTPVSWSTGYPVQSIANDNRVTEARKYLDDGSSLKSIISYDQALGDNNHINDPIQVDEYDFGNVFKRRSTTSYFTGGNYTGTGVNTLNILSLPLEQAVYDAGDLLNPKSRTIYEYDNYTADGNNDVLKTYNDYSSIPGRDQTFDTGYVTRGNATKVTRMITSSSAISSYTRYDVLGNVVSAKDTRANETKIDYLDDFGLGSNPGSNTGGHSSYALPTKFTSPHLIQASPCTWRTVNMISQPGCSPDSKIETER